MSNSSRQASLAETIMNGIAANTHRVREQQARMRAIENALGFELEPCDQVPVSRKIGLFNALHAWVERCVELRKAGLPISLEQDKILETVFKVILNEDGRAAMALLADWNQT